MKVDELSVGINHFPMRRGSLVGAGRALAGGIVRWHFRKDRIIIFN